MTATQSRPERGWRGRGRGASVQRCGPAWQGWGPGAPVQRCGPANAAAAVKGREEVPRELRTELPRDPAGPLVGTRPTK